MMGGRLLVLLAVLFIFAGAGAADRASAHFASTGFSDIRVETQDLYYSLYLSEHDLDQALSIDGDGDGVLSEEELDAAGEALETFVSNYLIVTGDGKLSDGALEKIELTERSGTPVVGMTVRYRFEQPIDRYMVQYGVFADGTDPNHRNLATVHLGGQSIEQVLSPTNNLIQIKQGGDTVGAGDGKASWVKTLKDYTALGIHHIWTGFDHLLFLFGLLIAARSFKAILAIVTAFTIGHSVTLALASLGIFSLPASIVEPLIALSIIYIAVENVIGKSTARRWLTALLFGLLHGFGFAGMLADQLSDRVALPLFAFNLGVEIGQVAVLAVAVPLLWLIRTRLLAPEGRQHHKQRLQLGASVLIGGFGVFWFIERIL